MSNVDAKVSRFSLFLCLFLLLFTAVRAQSNRQLLKKGDKFFKKEAYRSALPYYEQVLAKDPDNAAALFRAGISYIAFDKEKASEYIYRAQRLKPKVSPEIEYWLGRIDHLNYKFDEAIAHFRLYDAKLKRTDLRREEVADLVQKSKNAKALFNSPRDIYVKNLGPTINTSRSEHSPVIASDDNYLLFTSRAENVTGGKEDRFGLYYEDIFETRRTGDETFEQPRPLARINSKYHDAAIQLFDNDTKLLLYRDENNGDFYVSTREKGGEWSAPRPLSSTINSRDYEGDAFITPDGQQLYFSTSHYSEHGDKDIYLSQRDKNGDWAKPRSLGPTINSLADDDSPYLGPDGKTLYFTSRGHNSMGGYDVFVSRYDSVSRKWGKPENMGYPINTPDDDAYYRLSPDGSYAYLSSYRMSGYGEKDIWTINFIRPARLQGYVYSQSDSTVVPGVELVFSSQQADKKAISYRDISKPRTGAYGVDVLSGRTYQVTVTKDGRHLATQALEVPMVTAGDKVIEKDFYVPFADTAALNRFAFQKIYFDTDEHFLRPESIQELDKILAVLKANPQVNLSIDGHCDSRHSDEYNMVLGDHRARAAYDYLVKNGISERRLITVSYGERRPAAPNDSPENMQLNRRTEFTVIPRAGENAASRWQPAAGARQQGRAGK